jgi:small basic protein (TIGR04137 family)
VRGRVKSFAGFRRAGNLVGAGPGLYHVLEGETWLFSDQQGASMSIDKSLRRKDSLQRARNVLTRDERILQLMDEERWKEGRSPFGLPKVKVVKIKKVKKAAKEEETPAAEGAAAAAPAAGAEKK